MPCERWSPPPSLPAEPEAKKNKKEGAKGAKEKAVEGPILYQDPPDKLASPGGKRYTLKVTSWNVDGLRAWFKKKGLEVRAETGESRSTYIQSATGPSCKALSAQVTGEPSRAFGPAEGAE